MGKKQPKRDSTYKLWLIYIFEFYEEDHLKMFDAILHEKLETPYHFHNHTEEENQKFLARWRRYNNIRLCDFEIVKKPNLKKGVPEYIRRVNGVYHDKIDFMGEDTRE